MGRLTMCSSKAMPCGGGKKDHCLSVHGVSDLNNGERDPYNNQSCPLHFPLLLLQQPRQRKKENK